MNIRTFFQLLLGSPKTAFDILGDLFDVGCEWTQFCKHEPDYAQVLRILNNRYDLFKRISKLNPRIFFGK